MTKTNIRKKHSNVKVLIPLAYEIYEGKFKAQYRCLLHFLGNGRWNEDIREYSLLPVTPLSINSEDTDELLLDAYAVAFYEVVKHLAQSSQRTKIQDYEAIEVYTTYPDQERLHNHLLSYVPRNFDTEQSLYKYELKYGIGEKPKVAHVPANVKAYKPIGRLDVEEMKLFRDTTKYLKSALHSYLRKPIGPQGKAIMATLNKMLLDDLDEDEFKIPYDPAHYIK